MFSSEGDVIAGVARGCVVTHHRPVDLAAGGERDVGRRQVGDDHDQVFQRCAGMSVRSSMFISLVAVYWEAVGLDCLLGV